VCVGLREKDPREHERRASVVEKKVVPLDGRADGRRGDGSSQLTAPFGVGKGHGSAAIITDLLRAGDQEFTRRPRARYGVARWSRRGKSSEFFYDRCTRMLSS